MKSKPGFVVVSGIGVSPLRHRGAEVICEHVRHRLGFQLVSEIQEADGALPLIQLNPSWEEMFQKYQLPEGSGIVDVALPPAEFNRLAGSIAERIAHAGAQGRYPAVGTSTKRRRFLHTVGTGWQLAAAVHAALGGQLQSAAWDRVAPRLEEIARAEPQIFDPPSLLDGHEIRELTGLEPGPELGRRIEALRIAQVEGRVATRDQAVAWLRAGSD